MPDLRVHEQFGDARQDLEDSAVGHHGNALDLPVVVGDELEMGAECFEAAPAGERLRADHDAGELPLRRDDWIDLARQSLEVRLLEWTIRSDNQDVSVA